MEYYSAIKRNEFESVVLRLMNIDPIKQNKASQKEENKYSILTYIRGIKKNGTDELSTEWICEHSRGRRGWD